MKPITSAAICYPGGVFEYLVLGGAALGAYGWERLRQARLVRRYHAAIRQLDDEAQVALHLAEREAQARHQPLTPLHLVYGVLQDAQLAALIGELGGDVDAIEQHTLALLDEPLRPEHIPALHHAQHELGIVLGTAIESARAHARQATCADLCARLAATRAGALLERGGIDPLVLQFRCVHGHPSPPIERPGEATVNVVIRNDDLTTAQLVFELLHDELGLAPDRAREVTQAAHAGGKAIVGQFASADARTRLERARARLRSARAPLWLGVEPC